jgi:hypothetical protein
VSQNGKGDSPRKKTVTDEVWARNWERIFGKKKVKKAEAR